MNGTSYREYHYGIGWDDLVSVDPLGNEVVLHYGRHWNFLCRVKLDGQLPIDLPEVDGTHDTLVLEDGTEYEFSVQMSKRDRGGVETVSFYCIAN